MNKTFLLIPFLALLGTSCGGGHITTTPVVKNAPSAVLNTPNKNNLITPSEMSDNQYFDFVITNEMTDGYYFLDGTPSEGGGDFASIRLATSGANTYISLYYGNYMRLALNDYLTIKDYINLTYAPNTYAPFGAYRVDSRPAELKAVMHFKPADHAYQNGYDNGEQAGYQEGRQEGYDQGYEEGKEDGYYTDSNKLIPNGMYTGLTIFPRRNYLQKYGEKVMSGQVNPENGQFYLIDTNANYTIEMKWTYNDSEKVTTFKSYGDLVVGELDWHDVAEGYWNSTWFGKYDAELHHFIDTKTYATKGPIETSFYPEVYLGSTFTGGDPNLYFAGGGNSYQMGFADGQTQTIHASETYQNIFTIFTPAFRAVADFFNLSFGPFKVWYFFAIPLIVTLLILVLRLVKH